MAQDKISKLKGEKLLEQASKWFTDSSSWDSDYKDNAKEWYDYYHGRQWTSGEAEELEARGQAVTTYNYIKPSIDSIIGSERQNRPKVTMAGRKLDDQKLAEAKTKLYDYIQYNSGTDDELDKQVRDGLVVGRGWMYVYPDTTPKKHNDVMHTYVDYRDMFTDPMSKKDDLTDARYVHYAVFTDSDIIKGRFKNFKEEENPQGAFGLGFESSSDDEIWYQDGDRVRPRLINTWYRDEEGIVHTIIWVKGQILYYAKDPYQCERFPFTQYTTERDLDNKPYGLVKSMTSAQDEVNKRHSKALHYLNAKQIMAEEDAFVDWSDALKQIAKPDGVIKLQDGALKDGKVQVIDNVALASTHIQMMQIARENLSTLVGLNPSFMGQGNQYESAKKANMSISQAQNSLVPILNKLRIVRYDLAYITMKLVPTYYSEERMIRLVEPNGEYAFMPLNTVTTLDDKTLAKINDLTSDDVDVIIEDAPRGLNEREEQFAQLLQIQGQTSDPIPMEVLLRYSSIKDKHQLATDIEGHKRLQTTIQQQQQQLEQMQGQIQEANGVVDQLKSQLVQVEIAREIEKEKSKLNKA